MNRRDSLVEIAKETIDISKKGKYQVGRFIYSFDTTNNTKLCKDINGLYKDFNEYVLNEKKRFSNTKMEVKQEGTVDAIFRLMKNKKKNLSLGVLNFASAYNPGGGFESGAMAQEECLAYCSDLYLKQITGEGKEYYDINRNDRTPFYHDTMFISNVTFFRNSNYGLVSEPKMCNVLTCPAVNMRNLFIKIAQLKDEGTLKAYKIAQDRMKDRMRNILYFFILSGCTDLVLGAFGCGVFGNRPEDVAKYWYELLVKEDLKSFFNSITFSIIDSKNQSQSNIEVFKQYF